MSVTLTIKEVNSLPIKIEIAIPAPPSKPVLEGSFIGHAIMRSKDELKALGDRVTAGDFENNDEALLKELYVGFSGIGDNNGKEMTTEESWDWVLKSKFSSQLSLLLMNRYYEGHAEARRGNSVGRR